MSGLIDVSAFNTDYCPQCCVVHVTCECPREGESEHEYWQRMARLHIDAPDVRLQFSTWRDLARIVNRTALSTRAIARRIGIASSELRSYMRGQRDCPYPIQFALESLQRKEPQELAVDVEAAEGKCIVQTLVGGEWENCWHVDDEPETFPNDEAAQSAIDEHLEDIEDADMSADQYRIVTIL